MMPHAGIDQHETLAFSLQHQAVTHRIAAPQQRTESAAIEMMDPHEFTVTLVGPDPVFTENSPA
jgi:hypothetical protein